MLPPPHRVTGGGCPPPVPAEHAGSTKALGSNVLRAVVDFDLEKFFDRVNHDILMARVAERVADKRVLKLIRTSERDFNTAFATLVQGRVGALLVPADPLFVFRREQLIALAARHALPAIYDLRE